MGRPSWTLSPVGPRCRQGVSRRQRQRATVDAGRGDSQVDREAETQRCGHKPRNAGHHQESQELGTRFSPGTSGGSPADTLMLDLRPPDAGNGLLSRKPRVVIPTAAAGHGARLDGCADTFGSCLRAFAISDLRFATGGVASKGKGQNRTAPLPARRPQRLSAPPGHQPATWGPDRLGITAAASQERGRQDLAGVSSGGKAEWPPGHLHWPETPRSRVGPAPPPRMLCPGQRLTSEHLAPPHHQGHGAPLAQLRWGSG